MLNSQILEVAIGLAFIYLLFCLICSMIKEWIASAWLKSRPKTLFLGIKSLLKDPEILYNFYKHPLINALANRPPLEDLAKSQESQKSEELKPGETEQKPKELTPGEIEQKLKDTLRKQPSSIPSRTFALALLDLLAPAKEATGPQTLAHIRNSVSQQTDPKYDWIKSALLPLLDAAQNDLAKAQKNLENWFDDAMERVTGWYKRRTQLYLIILALIVCAGMNVDTFSIANRLYHDSTLRAVVLAAADKTIKEKPPAVDRNQQIAPAKKPPQPAATQSPGTENKPKPQPTLLAKSPPTGTETKPPPTTPVQTPPPGTEVTTAATGEDKKLQEAIAKVQKLNLPIGWVVKSDFKNANNQEIGFPWNLAPLDRDLKFADDKVADPKASKVIDPKDLFPWNIGAFKLLGWIFTALAISLGAPFWFDLLNKLVNLRGGGKTPEKAPDAEKK